MSHDTQFWSMSQKGKMHKGAMLFEKEFLFMKMQEKKENYYFLPLDSLVKIWLFELLQSSYDHERRACLSCLG